MNEFALDPIVLDTLRQLTPPGEPDVLIEILELFVSDVPARLERLTAAVDAGDSDAIQRLAHSVGGSAGNIGARALHAAARALETLARTGELAGARDGASLVQHEFDRVSDEVHQLLA